MRDFYIEQDDVPGSLAYIGEILGDAGVNIEGLCFTKEGKHLLQGKNNGYN